MEIIQACGRCGPAIGISPPHLRARGCYMIRSSSLLDSMHKMRCGFWLRYTTTATAATRAILERSTSGSAAKISVGVENDRPLAIKKTASDLSIDLKGTSIFLVVINSNHKSNLGRILAALLLL